MTPRLVVTKHRAGFATYSGDCRHIIGETKGPTTYGGYVIAHAAEFDGERTRVEFRHLKLVQT